MQFTYFLVASFAAITAAIPTSSYEQPNSYEEQPSSYGEQPTESSTYGEPNYQEHEPLCSSALDTAQCCNLSVDGLAVLDCGTPSPTPYDVTNFYSTCAARGQTAQCCTLPLAGGALLCTNP